jgi:hypothetical protein
MGAVDQTIAPSTQSSTKGAVNTSKRNTNKPSSKKEEGGSNRCLFYASFFIFHDSTVEREQTTTKDGFGSLIIPSWPSAAAATTTRLSCIDNGKGPLSIPLSAMTQERTIVDNKQQEGQCEST